MKEYEQKLKRKQKENIRRNLTKLRVMAGLSVEDFCDLTNISKASYFRYIADDEHIPNPNTINLLSEYYHLSPVQLLNEEIPDDYFITHPDIFFTFILDNKTDKDVIKALEFAYDIKINDVINAFSDMELRVEFFVANTPPSIFKTPKSHYENDKYVRTVRTNYDKIFANDPTKLPDKEQKEIVDKYLDNYYKNIHDKKVYLMKTVNKRFAPENITVRISRLKQLQTISDDDYDIFETVKTMRLPQFFKYCNKLKDQMLKTFNISL